MYGIKIDRNLFFNIEMYESAEEASRYAEKIKKIGTANSPSPYAKNSFIKVIHVGS